MNRQEYLELNPVLVVPPLAQALGLNASIVLHQLHYWLELNQQSNKPRKFHDGKWWSYNSIKDWQATNFPWWSVDTVKDTFGLVEDLGLVQTANYNRLPIDKTKWYTIDYEALDRFMNLWEMSGSPNAGDGKKSLAYKKFLDTWEQQRMADRATYPIDGATSLNHEGNDPQAIPETTFREEVEVLAPNGASSTTCSSSLGAKEKEHESSRFLRFLAQLKCGSLTKESLGKLDMSITGNSTSFAHRSLEEIYERHTDRMASHIQQFLDWNEKVFGARYEVNDLVGRLFDDAKKGKLDYFLEDPASLSFYLATVLGKTLSERAMQLLNEPVDDTLIDYWHIESDGNRVEGALSPEMMWQDFPDEFKQYVHQQINYWQRHKKKGGIVGLIKVIRAYDGGGWTNTFNALVRKLYESEA